MVFAYGKQTKQNFGQGLGVGRLNRVLLKMVGAEIEKTRKTRRGKRRTEKSWTWQQGSQGKKKKKMINLFFWGSIFSLV